MVSPKRFSGAPPELILILTLRQTRSQHATRPLVMLWKAQRPEFEHLGPLGIGNKGNNWDQFEVTILKGESSEEPNAKSPFGQPMKLTEPVLDTHSLKNESPCQPAILGRQSWVKGLDVRRPDDPLGDGLI
ncbi:hypothetical protein FPHYL_4396 [Fusarium phyllophilum]|uniref:Uncharacterized protein n=1 Tax=Fusarium phyllophilum TaxID=47803 RepID=A0A8H5NH20_9HYPO|nr:hypothetical protein FPHYL_4396 [Fusarium phyllophilum]